MYGSRSGPNILLVLIWLQTVHECYQQMTKVCWSVVSKNGIYLGSAGQRLIWYLCKCIYYNIVTLFISTSIHFYFTLLVGNYLGILSSAVFSKLIYYIVPSLSLSGVKQFGFRSGLTFCRCWSGSKTVCKGYQQTTIAGKEKLQQCISNQLAGCHLVVCIYKQRRTQYVSWSAGFRPADSDLYCFQNKLYPGSAWYGPFYIINRSSYFCNFYFS